MPSCFSPVSAADFRRAMRLGGVRHPGTVRAVRQLVRGRRVRADHRPPYSVRTPAARPGTGRQPARHDPLLPDSRPGHADLAAGGHGTRHASRCHRPGVPALGQPKAQNRRICGDRPPWTGAGFSYTLISGSLDDIRIARRASAVRVSWTARRFHIRCYSIPALPNPPPIPSAPAPAQVEAMWRAPGAGRGISVLPRSVPVFPAATIARFPLTALRVTLRI
jgi:hypothetical protein